MLWAHAQFQLEILTINVISGIVYFCEINLKSSRNVSETTPRAQFQYKGYVLPGIGIPL